MPDDGGTAHSSLVEIRLLEGPNLYFTRPAVKVTLDVADLMNAPAVDLATAARRAGLPGRRPGKAGSQFRQQFVASLIARVLRQVATASGVKRLAVRARPTNDSDRLVLAFPWRHADRATALAAEVARAVDSLSPLDSAGPDVHEWAARLAAAGQRISSTEVGRTPTVLRPRVPVVAVTGTNGKTTTSRMIAAFGREAGRYVGWSNTDGIWLNGEQVEAGDYSGPAGARRVLADRKVDLAVTETARGGILLRGMGTAYNDVSVVTNISADHLGLQGIDTLDQLAEVKAVVTKVTRGWTVLNADDPRTLAMRAESPGRPWVFSRDSRSPGVRQVLNDGGRATTLIDGWISVLDGNGSVDTLVSILDVPMALSGLSAVNVENALAATSAGLAIGLPREAVIAGLKTFAPGPDQNPGRMNVYSLTNERGAFTVVVDLAHNEAGLAALLEILTGLCPTGSQVRLGLGTAGDRTDEILVALGELAARGAQDIVITHKSEYLRGRSPESMDLKYAEGAHAVGWASALLSYPDELSGLKALIERANPGDVVGLMCHQDREDVHDWLISRGATVDDPDILRAKVRAAS